MEREFIWWVVALFSLCLATAMMLFALAILWQTYVRVRDGSMPSLFDYFPSIAPERVVHRRYNFLRAFPLKVFYGRSYFSAIIRLGRANDGDFLFMDHETTISLLRDLGFKISDGKAAQLEFDWDYRAEEMRKLCL